MRVIVVGGGVIGLSSAYALLERGHDVTLLDSQDEVGMETSFANGGMLTASMPDPWNSPGVGRHLVSSLIDSESAMQLHLSAVPSLLFWGIQFLRNSTASRYQYSSEANFCLAQYSISRTEALRYSLSLKYDHSNAGTMKVFRNADAMSGPLNLAKSLMKFGLKFECFDADQTLEAEPQLYSVRDQISGALRFPGDVSGNARLFCGELASAFIRGGGKLETGVRVDSILSKRGRVVGVASKDGEFDGDTVILAAGNGSAELARPLSVRLPIRPAKGYSVTIDSRGLEGVPRLPVIDDLMHAAVVPLGDCLRLVGTAEFDRLNSFIQPKRINNLYKLLESLYPHLCRQIERDSVKCWAGFRPMSADGRPFIGGTPIKGLYINTGHGHLGWTKACGSAAILCDEIEGRKADIDTFPFRVNR